jgi:hypothetical protein
MGHDCLNNEREFHILNILTKLANVLDRFLLSNIKLLQPYAWQVVIIASNPKR